MVSAAHPDPAIAKNVCPDRKRRMTARRLVLRRKLFKKWLKVPEGELLEDRTLGDEWGFKLRGDRRFAMEKNPLRFLPCFDQREPNKAVEGWDGCGSCEHCIFHRIHNATKSHDAKTKVKWYSCLKSKPSPSQTEFRLKRMEMSIDNNDNV